MTATRPDPHVVLGVSRDASDAEIREAYRQRMRCLHPDRGGPDDPLTHAEIAAVNDAWRTLRSRTAEPDQGSEPAPNAKDFRTAPPSQSEAAFVYDGPVPTMLRTVMTIAIVLLLAWLAVFVVIAMSQSG